METIEWLKLQKELLKAQLRVVRDHLRACGEEGVGDRRVGPRSMSQMSMVRDVLHSAGTPLHLNDIILQVEQQFGVKLDRESVVSAMTKKVHKGVLFVRISPNTFGLK